MPHRLYELIEARHAAGAPVDLYYYEKALPAIAAAVAGRVDRATSDAALTAAFATDPPRPRTRDTVALGQEAVR